MASSREICRTLEHDGWVLDRQSGSHRQYKHPDRSGLVTVPHPVKDTFQSGPCATSTAKPAGPGRRKGEQP